MKTMPIHFDITKTYYKFCLCTMFRAKNLNFVLGGTKEALVTNTIVMDWINNSNNNKRSSSSTIHQHVVTCLASYLVLISPLIFCNITFVKKSRRLFDIYLYDVWMIIDKTNEIVKTFLSNCCPFWEWWLDTFSQNCLIVEYF